VLHRLVARADVFVTNVPLDGRARLGVGWDDLAPLNPRLIYGSITAYGETGEEASRPGFDSTALWARTGLMDLVRPSPAAPPLATGWAPPTERHSARWRRALSAAHAGERWCLPHCWPTGSG
jgi:formyl-CoA transferase